MSLFKTWAELTLKPLFFDLVYRLSGVSSAYVLKSDMECSFPVDVVPEAKNPHSVAEGNFLSP